MLATLGENCWMDLHEKFTTDVFVDKEEQIKFSKSSASLSWSRNFKKDSSTLRDSPLFRNLADISGRTDRIFTHILSQM